jgi:hypothetical protein
MKTLRRALPVFLLVALPVLAQETPAGGEKADVRLEVFDVRDLVTEEMRIEQLVRIAREEGGDGIQDATPHGKTALVVRATPEALERIRLALKELRGNASVVITLEIEG